MQTVIETPNKKWKLTAYKVDGEERIQTGYIAPWNFPKDTATYEVENRIVAAEIKVGDTSRGRSSVTFELRVRGSEHKLTTGPLGAAAMLQALQSGMLVLTGDGWIKGLWTFQKQGQEFYLFPSDGKKVFRGIKT